MLKRKTVKSVDEASQPISNEPALIQSLIATLSDKSTDRFRAAKKLNLISQTNPSLLYPHFEVFANLLENTSSILQWNGIIILSYLAAVDSSRRFDSIFDRYYSHLWDGKLITAANILVSSGRIARCRPDLAARITSELLKVDLLPLPTPECREVARGHVLSSFSEYLDLIDNNPPVRDFINRCTGSHRPAVRKRAEKLLAQTG